MNPGELRARRRAFSLRVIKLVQTLPKNMTADVFGKQVLRSATSVGANYRAACRAQSEAMFIAKLSIVVEPKLLAEVIDEAEQILIIMAASCKTAKH